MTFDLPLGDGLHLSGEANRLLGIRFARAMRQHVYGEAVDGTGPRLVSVTRPASDPRLFRVTFTQAISESGGDFHVILYKCKATDGVEGELSDGAFWLTSASGTAIGRTSDDNVYDFVENETATAIDTSP